MSEETKPTIQERLWSYCHFTLAAKVAFAVGVSLLSITIATWFVYNAQPQRVAWGDYLNGTQIATLVCLWIATCAITYWTVLLWSEAVPVRYSELEIAWRAGSQKMSQRGIDLQQLPLFLVLGCHDEKSQQQILKQSGLQPMIGMVPTNSGAPIRWSITEECVLVFCSHIGLLGAMQSRISLLQPHSLTASMHPASIESFRNDALRTKRLSTVVSDFDRAAYAESEPLVAHNESRELYTPTQTDSFPRQIGAGAGVSTEQRLVRRQGEFNSLAEEATRRLDETEELIAKFESRSGLPFESTISSGNPPSEILSSNEQVEYQAMLEDFCRRLRGKRSATAPINGVLAWIDAPQLMESSNLSAKLGESLRRDLCELETLLGVQTPVTVFLDRMHAVPGFSELIRRIGPERAAVSVLGEAYSLEKCVDPSSINQLSRNAIRTLCSAAYHHFHAANGTGQPGNHKLFQLVAVCRGKLSRALQPFLVQSMSAVDRGDRIGNETSDSTMLGGVFFASSSDEPIQQGFVRGVLTRMLDQQGLLNWTSRRRRAELRYSRAILAMQCITVLLVVALVMQIVFRSR